jgi:hypothetical protein
MRVAFQSLSLLSGVIFCFMANEASALPFGTYDPRSLAMGGTGVGAATGVNAVFYNPALLAQYSVYEEESNNSAFVLPSVAARVSDSLVEAEEFRQDDLDTLLRSSINAFNTNPTAQNAQAVLDASESLQSGLQNLSGGPAFVDGAAGFVISIPSKHEGGAFLFSRRAVGDGLIDFTDQDARILNAYVETMTFVTTNGAAGALHPEILDQNNDLIDQTDNLTSTASASAMLITELGIAMSREFKIFANKIAFGVTPKFVNVRTYDVLSSTNDSPEENEDRNNDWDMNLDVGAAHDLSEKLTLGLAIKNIVPRRYITQLNNELRIDPQLRAGLAYAPAWGVLALDVDVLENDPVGSGSATQNLGLGAEWALGWGSLRGGFSYNFAAPGAIQENLFSVGASFALAGVLADFAYADNDVEQAASFQLGFRF